MAEQASGGPQQSSILRFPDVAHLVTAATEEFVRLRQESIVERGRFNVALSGGSTPRALHQRLAKEHPEAGFWEQVHLYFGDERAVPPQDKQSNFRMAEETLFSGAKIPPENIHRVEAELPPREAAERYEEELRRSFALRQGEWPRFDLIFLGMGPDGHTASLFPDTKALEERSRLVVANWVEKSNTWRITFSFPVLNHAREIIFLVTGQEKASMIAQILGGAAAAESYPARRVVPEHGRLLWMLDEAAASELGEG